MKICISYKFTILKKIINSNWGWRVIEISGSLIWSKTLVELIFNPCVEFRWSPEGPVTQIHSPHLHIGAPGIFSDLLRSVQMLKREWGTESNFPLLFIPIKLHPSFLSLRWKNLPLGRTAALVPGFAVNDLPLGRTLWWWWWWLPLLRSSLHSTKIIKFWQLIWKFRNPVLVSKVLSNMKSWECFFLVLFLHFLWKTRLIK